MINNKTALYLVLSVVLAGILAAVGIVLWIMVHGTIPAPKGVSVHIFWMLWPIFLYVGAAIGGGRSPGSGRLWLAILLFASVQFCSYNIIGSPGSLFAGIAQASPAAWYWWAGSLCAGLVTGVVVGYLEKKRSAQRPA